MYVVRYFQDQLRRLKESKIYRLDIFNVKLLYRRVMQEKLTFQQLNDFSEEEEDLHSKDGITVILKKHLEPLVTEHGFHKECYQRLFDYCRFTADNIHEDDELDDHHCIDWTEFIAMSIAMTACNMIASIENAIRVLHICDNETLDGIVNVRELKRVLRVWVGIENDNDKERLQMVLHSDELSENPNPKWITEDAMLSSSFMNVLRATDSDTVDQEFI